MDSSHFSPGSLSPVPWYLPTVYLFAAAAARVYLVLVALFPEVEDFSHY